MQELYSRLLKFIEFQGFSVSAFEKNLSLPNGAISRSIRQKRVMGADRIKLIVEKFPNLSSTWLLTGKGKMIVETISLNYNIDRNTDLLANCLAQTELIVEMLAESYTDDKRNYIIKRKAELFSEVLENIASKTEVLEGSV